MIAPLGPHRSAAAFLFTYYTQHHILTTLSHCFHFTVYCCSLSPLHSPCTHYHSIILVYTCLHLAGVSHWQGACVGSLSGPFSSFPWVVWYLGISSFFSCPTPGELSLTSCGFLAAFGATYGSSDHCVIWLRFSDDRVRNRK